MLKQIQARASAKKSLYEQLAMRAAKNGDIKLLSLFVENVSFARRRLYKPGIGKFNVQNELTQHYLMFELTERIQRCLERYEQTGEKARIVVEINSIFDSALNAFINGFRYKYLLNGPLLPDSAKHRMVLSKDHPAIVEIELKKLISGIKIELKRYQLKSHESLQEYGEKIATMRTLNQKMLCDYTDVNHGKLTAAIEQYDTKENGVNLELIGQREELFKFLCARHERESDFLAEEHEFYELVLADNLQTRTVSPLTKYLDSFNVSINLVDSIGNTLLHHAVICGQIETVEFLINQGAEKDIVNSEGKTPWMYANILNNIEMFKLVKKMDIMFNPYRCITTIPEMLPPERIMQLTSAANGAPAVPAADDINILREQLEFVAIKAVQDDDMEILKVLIDPTKGLKDRKKNIRDRLQTLLAEKLENTLNQMVLTKIISILRKMTGITLRLEGHTLARNLDGIYGLTIVAAEEAIDNFLNSLENIGLPFRDAYARTARKLAHCREYEDICSLQEKDAHRILGKIKSDAVLATREEALRVREIEMRREIRNNATYEMTELVNNNLAGKLLVTEKEQAAQYRTSLEKLATEICCKKIELEQTQQQIREALDEHKTILNNLVESHKRDFFVSAWNLRETRGENIILDGLVSPCIVDPETQNPLVHQALLYHNQEPLKLLIERGAHHELNRDGLTLFDVAFTMDNEKKKKRRLGLLDLGLLDDEKIKNLLIILNGLFVQDDERKYDGNFPYAYLDMLEKLKDAREKLRKYTNELIERLELLSKKRSPGLRNFKNRIKWIEILITGRMNHIESRLEVTAKLERTNSEAIQEARPWKFFEAARDALGTSPRIIGRVGRVENSHLLSPLKASLSDSGEKTLRTDFHNKFENALIKANAPIHEAERMSETMRLRASMADMRDEMRIDAAARDAREAEIRAQLADTTRLLQAVIQQQRPPAASAAAAAVDAGTNADGPRRLPFLIGDMGLFGPTRPAALEASASEYESGSAESAAAAESRVP